MKKFILLFLTTICLTFNSFAQTPCMTFLGIPIDGTKREMISKLEAKGYDYDSYADCLIGEFNGKDAIIYLNTIHNKVWRIIVVDKTYINETDIKIRFNTLFEQFSNNSKYTILDGNRLTEKDNISYEMMVNNKRYDAYFIPVDTSINGLVWYTIRMVSVTQYQIGILYENLNNAADGSEL